MTRSAKRPEVRSIRDQRLEAAAGPLRLDGRCPDRREVTSRAGRDPREPGWRNAYWLVLDGAGSGPALVGLADGRILLPVFGFDEEADLFAWVAHEGGRDVRRVEADVLVSLLRGPLGGVELVALDPLSDAEDDVLEVSVSLTRQRFLDLLRGPENPPDRRVPAGPAIGGPDRRIL